MIERTEKLKLAMNKISALEKDFNEKKELLSATEKKKTELMLQKNEIEDREFNLSNRLKQTEVRFSAASR